MVFSSLFFLFAFLPITYGLYVIAPQKNKNHVLLLMSLLFYIWGEGIYAAVMFASIIINYGVGIGFQSLRGHWNKKILLLFGCTINLGILFYFKYWTFFWGSLFGMEVVDFYQGGFNAQNVHLPIGISFFTFQGLSYLVDVYRGNAAVQRNLVHLATYISLFPQLIAGPIVRYSDIAEQLVERKPDSRDFFEGVRRFTFGLSKKVLIANPLGSIADQILELPTGEWDSPVCWLAIICYTYQIYYDFSGYSDMAIGLGRLFGFRFKENFDYPYSALSIQDFWRRWHISLSTWFRDYLYIPLGGNKKGPSRTYAHLFLVFLLCGLWHGASWNFVLWGCWHGGFLVVERAFRSKTVKAPKVLSNIYVMLVVIFGWVLFRVESLDKIFIFAESLFQFKITQTSAFSYYFNREVQIVLALGIFLSFPLFKNRSIKEQNQTATLNLVLSGAYLIVLLMVNYLFLSGGSYNPFIYFRF